MLFSGRQGGQDSKTGARDKRVFWLLGWDPALRNGEGCVQEGGGFN